MKTETLKFKSIKDLLSRSDMKKIVAGCGCGSGSNDSLAHCATSYAVRSCNNLGCGEMQGWLIGWASGSCSQYNGATLWGAAVSSGIPMNGSCNTSWYSY
jgi:hypothetical protein